jgi:hypothetical protein
MPSSISSLLHWFAILCILFFFLKHTIEEIYFKHLKKVNNWRAAGEHICTKCNHSVSWLILPAVSSLISSLDVLRHQTSMEANSADSNGGIQGLCWMCWGQGFLVYAYRWCWLLQCCYCCKREKLEPPAVKDGSHTYLGVRILFLWLDHLHFLPSIYIVTQLG